MRGIALLTVLGLALFLAVPSVASDGSTELSIDAPEAISPGQDFVVSAELREHATALPGRELVFFRETLFGAIEIGRTATDSTGRASVVVSLPSTGTVVLYVSFEGDGILRPSRVASTVLVGGTPATGPDFTAILVVGAVVALVLGSVWACYAFVLTQLVEIRNEGRRSVARHGGKESDR